MPRAMQSAMPARGRRERGQRRSWGGRFDRGLASPFYRVALPDRGEVEVPVDDAAYSWTPIVLAAAVGSSGNATIRVDDAADFEWVSLNAVLTPAAPVLVSFNLQGGPFAGVSLTSRPIRDSLVIGSGQNPGMLPAGALLPKSSGLRVTLTNLTATAQTIELTATGRNVYTPRGSSLSDVLVPRIPFWYGYEFTPLAAAATNARFALPPDTTGDFELHYHNAIAEATVGAGSLGASWGVNLQDTGERKGMLYTPPPNTNRIGVRAIDIAGTAQLPGFVRTRRLVRAGQSLDVLAEDIQAAAAPQTIYGVLGGLRYLSDDYFAEGA